MPRSQTVSSTCGRLSIGDGRVEADRGAAGDDLELERRGGGRRDEIVGLFVDAPVVGGAGLRRRIGQGGLEIGCWVHRVPKAPAKTGVHVVWRVTREEWVSANPT